MPFSSLWLSIVYRVLSITVAVGCLSRVVDYKDARCPLDAVVVVVVVVVVYKMPSGCCC